MKHDRTVIYFTDKDKTYKVEYHYKNTLSRDTLIEKHNTRPFATDSYSEEELQASIYENEKLVKKFSPIPTTKSQNPTKSQAKELIRLAFKKKTN